MTRPSFTEDADGSTPLHIAVQNTNAANIELLLQHGSTEQLYIENSVGQTPLDIASLKNISHVTAPVQAGRFLKPQANINYRLRILENVAPFDVEKQKVEIPKLCATLDALLADGRLVRDTKLANELLTFAGYMEDKLTIEMERKNAVGKDTEVGDGNEVNPPQGTRPNHAASTYALVKRSLTQEAERALFTSSRQSDEELKEIDPEEQRIADLKSRSMFGSASTKPRVVPYKNLVDLFGEDRS